MQSVRFAQQWWRICCLFAMVICGCNSPPPATELPMIVGQFADEIERGPIEAVDAFFDASEFYIQYRAGNSIIHAGGDWAQRIPLDDVRAGVANPGPFILPMRYRHEDAWQNPPGTRISGAILSIEDWQSFRDSLFASVLPESANSGIVMHFFVDDYFLYYDANGKFQATLIQDKPAEYAIRESLSFNEFLQNGAPLLEDFLESRGISERRVLFNTGDTGTYSLPFLYVNLDLPLAVFIRYEPNAEPRERANVLTPYVQTAGHVAKSHIGDVMFRPVSSVFRLFFVATNAVRETATPNWLVALKAMPMAPLHQGPGMDLDEWENELDALTKRGPSRGTIEYLVDGEAFFTRFIDAVVNATESIHLRTYIFDNDDFALKIGDLLKRRSNEGVEVRLLFDGLGTIISTIERQDSLPDDWEPPPSVHRFLESNSKIDVRQASNPWLTGDHVKTTIVDRQVAFTGGMNIAREYRYDWHDLMMEVHGPVVDILQDEFRKAWAHAGTFGDLGYFLQRLRPLRHDAEDIGYPVRVLHTRTDNPEIFNAQRSAIRNARRYIYVENAYFTDDALLYELVKARRRGVDVRIIVPLVTDRGPITRNNALAANAMLEHGIRVFVYPGMSHVKAAVFDGWACLGSANWDKWSLNINKELNLATSNAPAVNDLLEMVFEPDFASSVELTEPFPERWSDYLLELVGDYLF